MQLLYKSLRYGRVPVYKTISTILWNSQDVKSLIFLF